MTKVTELGYLGLLVRDLNAWRTYATEVVGMELVDEGENDRCYLRMDSWHHRITLHASDRDGLAYLGWRVAGEVEFDAMATTLAQAGIGFTIASRAEAAERHVLGLMKLADPGGNPTEIFYAPLVERYRPFHPGRPMFGRFLTGELGLGHCLIGQEDVEAAKRFYRTLGLAGGVQYVLPIPGVGEAALTFMSLNARQHSVAFGAGPIPGGIQHLMIEYTELDDVGLAHDLVRARGVDVAVQLGKHSNDEALTFYCANPSGWLWELGWGGRAPPTQQEHYRRDMYGHRNEAKGYGNDIELT